ncbi:MAG: protein kinase [Prevotella sp.]|nr:protein kinase [Prevotella sp.]
MESSQFTNLQLSDGAIEQLDFQGATSDTYSVKLYGKLHFLKRLKAECVNDVRYQEAFQKEFETGYRLEHQGLPRYISKTDDGIMMEYVDGETLTERITCNPSYFNQKNTRKFILQLLDVVQYLHAHQVLHLDLKPDNILLTRIDNDVKLIDLGCCYTDTFTDTQGHTKGYAAPEQLREEATDERTDIYAIGKIIESLPEHYIYNKVIARCIAESPRERYQSIDEIKHDISRGRGYLRYVTVFFFVAVLSFLFIILLPHLQEENEMSKNENTPVQRDSSVLPEGSSLHSDEIINRMTSVYADKQSLSAIEKQPQPVIEKDEKTQLKDDTDRMIDEAYRATIVTFCDSVFPPQTPSSGKAWADATTSFHNHTLQIANRLSEKYPNIPESAIRQDCETRFQSLVSSVFNQMRNNARQ